MTEVLDKTMEYENRAWLLLDDCNIKHCVICPSQMICPSQIIQLGKKINPIYLKQ